MKTTALAALALLALPPGSARAETITKERVGCRSQEVSDRLLKFVMAADEEGYGRLLRTSLANGECRVWKPGEEVRLENRTGVYGCFAAEDAAGACYWTSMNAIEKPE